MVGFAVGLAFLTAGFSMSAIGAQTTTTAELVHVRQSPSSDDYFAIFSDNTQRWVPDSCAISLLDEGFTSRYASYNAEIGSRTQRSARPACGDLAAMLRAAESDDEAPSQPTWRPEGAPPVVSGNRVTMGWGASTDNIGVASYEVRLRNLGNTDVCCQTTVDGNQHNATFSNVAPGRYLAQVRAVDAAGNKSRYRSLQVRVSTLAEAAQMRAQVDEIADGIERFVADGNEFVDIGGNNGQGWFGLGDRPNYPVSMADVLIGGGYLPSSYANVFWADFMVYRCGSGDNQRVGVFAIGAGDSPNAAAWNSCTQNPILLGRNYFQVSATKEQIRSQQPALSAQLVTVQTKSPQDGFALYSDGTQHWVTPACFADLRNAGISAARVSFSDDVASRSKRARMACVDLASLISGGSAPLPTPPPQPTPPGNQVAVRAPGTVIATGQSLTNALQQADPGTTFVLQGGDYNPITVSGVNGQAGAPVIIMVETGQTATFRANSYERGTGLRMLSSSHVEIRDIHVRQSLFGIYLDRVNNVILNNVDVANTGQEAIRVRASNGGTTRDVEIRNSLIGDTGNRPGSEPHAPYRQYRTYGEGIYVGDGGSVNRGGENVSEIVIEDNTIFDTTGEAIDIKAGTRDVEIRRNTIRDINTGTSGAVVIHVDGTRDSNGNRVGTNPKIVVESNTIRNVRTWSEYADGNAVTTATHVTIRNNRFENLADYGIRVESKNIASNVAVTVVDQGNQVVGANRGARNVNGPTGRVVFE